MRRPRTPPVKQIDPRWFASTDGKGHYFHKGRCLCDRTRQCLDPVYRSDSDDFVPSVPLCQDCRALNYKRWEKGGAL